MREEALKDIGRDDLSLLELTKYPMEGSLDRDWRRPQDGMAARVVVNLTAAQRKALDRAAIARGTSASHILRTAGLKRARIALPTPQPLGRPIGS
jgi:hypothetical protein